jgi:hypothetical protein
MKELNKKLQVQFDRMCATGKLFKANISTREVWKIYLEGFVNEATFRDPESGEHNCNHCNNFIRRYGNIIALGENLEIMTIFDVFTTAEYQNSVDNMAKAIGQAGIVNIFFETYAELQSLPYEKTKKNQEVFRLGVDSNPKRYTQEEADKFGVVTADKVYTFNHFYLDLPARFVATTSESIESIQAKYRSDKDVFKRGMLEIPLATLELVRDLISQDSLLNGDAHLSKVQAMIPLKKEFDQIHEDFQDAWCWDKSYKFVLAKFKNELIGVLCTELAEGKELNDACKAWNIRVDPANYMKAVAPITENQRKEAQRFVEENGYVESFDRRHAHLDDIKVNEILHSNVGDGKIKEISMFDNIKTKSTQHKKSQFDGIEEVTIDNFMEKILPTCSSVEAYVENRHESNFVNMTTINQSECKDIFKWNNPFSWTYKGNLAGKSEIKDAVKLAGGNIDGVLNFRLAWNSEGGTDGSDLDVWAQEPNKVSIGYSTGYRKDSGNLRTGMSGQLDVDNQTPNKKLAVENITWTKKDSMKDGVYKLYVHQFSANNSQGFKAEVEFEGEIFEYSYPNAVTGYIQVAEVTLLEGVFSIKHLLPSTSSTREIYGLETGNFHKVNLMCLSPNHWGDNETGNKHYFFMMNKCKTDEGLRGFHSENLKPDLANHRKVLEVLGAVNTIEPSDRQLAGLGFNATVRDSIILKLGGNFKRTIRVRF